MESECKRLGVRILLGHAVSRVEWGNEDLRIEARNSKGLVEFVSDCAVVTLPLGILQLRPGEPGYVEFDPPLREKERALAKLLLGHVRRVQFVFNEIFWADAKFVRRNDLSDLQFLFSNDEFFPTWWSYAPLRVPVLTAWSPALKSDRLKGMPTDEVAEIALNSLSKILNIDVAELRQKVVFAHSHDWITDPFTRGAYSYAKAGGVDGFRELAQPLADKLFFAGEATESTGHHATVHGAIASGERAANEVLAHATEASSHNR
jgi:monoamine oxidase